MRFSWQRSCLSYTKKHLTEGRYKSAFSFFVILTQVNTFFCCKPGQNMYSVLHPWKEVMGKKENTLKRGIALRDYLT